MSTTASTTQGGPVVIAAATVIDGTVLRWYRNIVLADHGGPLISASRRGVSIHTTYLHEVPAGWLEDAQRAYELLRDRHEERARAEMATHRRTSLMGTVVPIERPAPTQSTPDGG